MTEFKEIFFNFKIIILFTQIKLTFSHNTDSVRTKLDQRRIPDQYLY